jgi:aldehyde:ferredoxin oxidoreductase
MVHSGFSDRILKVDLSSGRIRADSRGEEFSRTYFGGRAVIAHELLTGMGAGVDPLSPENVLVFAPGVVTGAPIGGTGRNSVGAKSPLTGGFGDAEAGGYWGAELKMAGYDAIVVTGKAEKPVYLSIIGDEIELRDARNLTGKDTAQVEDLVKRELGERSARVCQCGPAGERLVRFACVVNDLHHFAGRCGMGAVMGSKNLRAIAVRGKKKIIPKDPVAFSRVADWLRKNHRRHTGDLHDLGTMSVLLPLHMSGGLPTRNFREGSFEGADAISGESLKEKFLVATGTCFACPVRCKRVVEAKRPWRVDRVFGGPEYETAAALGSDCGVSDLTAVAKAGELCNRFGLDTISTGATIAFAMECFEAGIFPSADTDGLELRFGNARAMVRLVEMIAKREGIGDLLAEGVKRASEELGGEAAKFALEVKGQEIPMHEPRLKHGLGLGYAVSPTGADHCHNLHDTLYARETSYMKNIRSLGILAPLDVRDLGPEKVRLYKCETTFRHFQNCAVMCLFLPYEYDHVVDIVKGVTGWNASLWELMKVGERAVNLARVFNIREGFTEADDRLPARFFTPFSRGPLKGVSLDAVKLKEAVKIYYEMMGWSADGGVPGRGVLADLGIGWSHELLERESGARRRKT